MKKSIISTLLICGFSCSLGECRFKRIDQNEIKRSQLAISTSLENDARKRVYVLAGIGAVTAAAGVSYLLYRMHYAGNNVNPIKLPPVTLENVHQRVSALERFKMRLTGENIQSTIFGLAKMCSYHLFWILGPALAVEAIKDRVLRLHTYINELFYVASIEWVIQYKAHLGKLIQTYDITDIQTEVLAEGHILLDLLRSADDCKAERENINLSPLSQKRFEEAWASVIDALIITIAYMHMRIDEFSALSYDTLPLLDRTDRLTKYTNELSTQFERILENPKEYAALPDMIRRFKSELEKHIIVFRNLESQCVCLPKYISGSGPAHSR